MKKLDYNEYKEVNGMFAVMSKKEYVQFSVEENLSAGKDNKRLSRSINGAQVGNRHALKRGFRLWNHFGKVIDHGNNPIVREAYSPNF